MLCKKKVVDCTRFRKYTQLLNIIVRIVHSSHDSQFTGLQSWPLSSGCRDPLTCPESMRYSCLSISRWRVSQGRLPLHFLSWEYTPAQLWKRDQCMSRTSPLSSGYSKIGEYSPAALAWFVELPWQRFSWARSRPSQWGSSPDSLINKKNSQSIIYKNIQCHTNSL